MNNNFTNILLVVVLVLLVGFGVWYFTARNTPAPQPADSGIQIDIGGGNDDGTADQGPGDR